MSGIKYNNYAVGDVNATSIMQVLDITRMGLHKVSLTQLGTTTRPEISSGSAIEINGALFIFATDEFISGTPSTGDTYIKLTPAGSSVTAAFTNTAPTWSTEKYGWYESGTNNRYVNYKMFYQSSDGSFNQKVEFPNRYLWDIDIKSGDDFSYSNSSDITSFNHIAYSESLDNNYYYTSFIVKKPIAAYIHCTHGAATERYCLSLNPGKYRLWTYRVSAQFGIDLFLTGSTWYNLYTSSGAAANNIYASVFVAGVYGMDSLTVRNNNDDLSAIGEEI